MSKKKTKISFINIKKLKIKIYNKIINIYIIVYKFKSRLEFFKFVKNNKKIIQKPLKY